MAEPDPENDPILIFGATLRKIREDAKLTQGQVAEAMGTTQAYVSGVERGLENPSLRACVALARAVGAFPNFFTLAHAFFTHRKQRRRGSISRVQKRERIDDPAKQRADRGVSRSIR